MNAHKQSRPWEIYLVHHSHVDIGYTDPQPIAMRKQADFIAQALDYCTATDHLPSGERFVWTCEVSWTVKAFLKRYPERAEEFFRRVREGRIEVTGIYLNLTDLFDEDLLKHSISYAHDLADDHGFSVETAMQSDVNGWAWGLPKMLSEQGIRYFDIGINQTRSLVFSPRPRPFYWVSPGGERVLLWHGESYMHGNNFLIDPADGIGKVREYLKSLETSGYPHSAVAMRVHGATRDNAPPALWLCDFVREWNAHQDYPKLRLCTSREWFQHLESSWPEPIEELQKAWPDWWTDGIGSAAYESALVRTAEANLKSAKAIEASGGRLDQETLSDAQESSMFFAEHTWGAWCSTDSPDSLESKAGWNVKSGFAYTAAVESSALVYDALRTYAGEAKTEPAVLVFNPLPHTRTDIAEISIPNAAITGHSEQVLSKEIEESCPPLHLVDLESGTKIPVSRRPVILGSDRMPGQIIRFVANDVPGSGSRRYGIVPGALEMEAASVCSGSTIQNAFFKVEVDPVTGGIRSLYDKRLGRELVACGEYTLNQLIHETVDSPEGREALSTWAELRKDTPFIRQTEEMSLEVGPVMPFGASLIVEGKGKFHSVKNSITLYDNLPRIDIQNCICRLPSEYTESFYQAFPIGKSGCTVYLDTPGAVMRPGIDQLPETATDWHGLQNYFAASDGSNTTTVASPDIPIVQVNGINTGKWQKTLPAHNGLVMSWVMNNYWFTNFPATQRGELSYRYSISSYAGGFDPEASSGFASSIRQPLACILISHRP